jgi:hypothetical protein
VCGHVSDPLVRAASAADLGRPLFRSCKDLDVVPDQPPPIDVLALNEALENLERDDPICAKLVKLRYFAGLGHGEAAEALGLTRQAADRHWAFAPTWLYDRLGRDA